MTVLGSIFGAFWLPFSFHLGSQGLPEAPVGAQRVFLMPFFQHLFFIPFFGGFLVPPGSPQFWGRRHGGLTSGGMVKHHFGSKSGEIPMGKQHFGE